MANKKINQLVLKTTIQPTDLFPLGDATTGQLFKKTVAELQAAIGGAVISVNGLVGTVVLDTDDIQELASPTNRYFTEARARAAISLTTTGSSGASTYSNSTGVLNVPTYTLAGLGGIGASFLSGGTGITYNSGTGVIAYSGTVYTDSSIRALFSAGTGISYNSSTGAFSYSGTVYTDSSIRALISLTTSGSSGASTYNNTTGVLNVPTYTLAGLGGISLTSLSGSAPITYNSSTGAIGITQASGSTNGFLSSTDWNTFNGKQSALTLGNVTESVSNVLMFPDGGTNKTIGNLSIQVVQAGSTSSGYLSTTDWNTFNNKQGTITLTTTGTSGAATFSGGTLNIPQYQAALTNPVTGTGTTGHVAYFNGSGSIAGDAGHFWDNTNKRLGIGIATPSFNLHIKGADFGILAIDTTGGNNSQLRLQINGSILSAITAASSDSSMQFFNNGSERMRITSAGNVGIGTSSPAGASGTTLEINGVTGQSRLAIKNNATGSTSSDGLQIGVDTGGAAFIENRGANSLQLNTNGSARLFITSAGNVGIGASTSPTYLLEVSTAGGSQRIRVGTLQNNNNSATFEAITTANNSTASAAFFRANAGGSISIGTSTYNKANGDSGNFANLSAESQTVRMTITSGGNILMGTETDNGERLYVSGSIRATGSITANSDVRLKKNIERIENALQKVSEISGYTYNTIYDEDRHAGVIAQEIDKVLPEIVNKGNDGLMGVEYGNISALLIEAIKDLKVQNDSLQARLSALEK
jgi:hypothetical protein